ncbi:MAG: hypothetical protein RL662_1104 [Bacteroidota bacterium]|jgi:hypothetical protein
MKKTIYLFAVLSIMGLMQSCSSEQPILDSIIENQSQMEEFSINIGAFEEFKVQSNDLRASSFKDANIKHIHYFVYSMPGEKIVKQKNFFDLADPVIKDTLPRGEYKIAILASTYKNENYKSSYNFITIDTPDLFGGNFLGFSPSTETDLFSTTL